MFTLAPSHAGGADVIAAIGAALGSASVVFADVDPAYSRRLLYGAFVAYDAAAKRQGTLSAAVDGDAAAAGAGAGAKPYPSRSFLDDMAWCAYWLHERTGDYKLRMAVQEVG